MFEHDMTCSNMFEHGYRGQLRLYTTTYPLLGDVFEAPYLQMLGIWEGRNLPGLLSMVLICTDMRRLLLYRNVTGVLE